MGHAPPHSPGETPARFEGPPPGAPPRHAASLHPYSQQQAPAHAAPAATATGYKVRLSNVPPELTARDLAEAFGEVSQSRVESVDLLRDSRGVATGESLVVFGSSADAQNAVRRYHGGNLNGRRLTAVYEGEVYATPSQR